MKNNRKGLCLRILLFFLLGLILIAVGSVFLLKYLLFKGSPATSFSARTATDAIRRLESLSNEFGYKNALSELTEKGTTVVDGDRYYRLQQNYQGIPVYGRTVVCATNENGDVISITGNVVDVESFENITPNISYDEAVETAKRYIANVQNVDDLDRFWCSDGGNHELFIFCSDEDGNTHLVYCISLIYYIDAIDQYDLLIDAQTGEVLRANSALCDASAIGYRASDTSHQNGFTVMRLNDGRYALINIEYGLYVYDLDHINSSKKLIDGSSYVVSNNNIFGDTEDESSQEDGADLLVNLSNIHKYYNSLVGFETRNGKFALYYNDSYSSGRNARGGTWGDNGLLIVGYTTGTRDIDVLAHEYGHIMSHTLVDWNSNAVETKAINEGLSDIFGEIAEAHIGGWTEPDWIMTGENINLRRNIRDPKSGGLAGNVKDKSIWNEANKGKEYYYSSIISHTAYLMWNGINGDNAKKFSIDDLARLWYRAMLMMPADCDFSTCRQIVEWAALAVDGLTETQRACIAEAFDAVGIYDTAQSDEILLNCDQNVVPGAVLNVYNVDGELHPSYTLEIVGTIAEHELLYSTNIISDTGFLYETTKTISSAKSFHLDLPDGYYTFKITDRNNPKLEYSFTVSVSEQGTQDIIELYTDFENQLIVHVFESKPEETTVKKSTLSIKEYVKFRTGLHCAWAVEGDFDDDGSSEIYAFVCTSATNYSNGQLWHFEDSSSRCLFYFDEAGSKLFCDIANLIPNWLAVALIDAVDSIDEFVTSIERDYF